MNTKEQLLFDKMEELIKKMKALSNSYEVTYNRAHAPIYIVRKSTLDNFIEEIESEISQLKSTLEKEQLSGTININDDSNSVMSGEQSEISAEEVLSNILGIPDLADKDVFDRGLYVLTVREALQAMHDFRNQGRDWEKIEKEFYQWADRETELNNFIEPLDLEMIVNWFKNNL